MCPLVTSLEVAASVRVAVRAAAMAVAIREAFHAGAVRALRAQGREWERLKRLALTVVSANAAHPFLADA